MFEFLITQSNTENPTFLSITITVLCAFFLASLIVVTYEWTSRSVQRPLYFLQSMALIAIVAATVMQAIGDSLARGLGMLGALAIIRFRTRISNPRNMAFMFAALACGIACGVFGFTIAIVGTVAFCLVAVLLHYSPLADTGELTGKLRITVHREEEEAQHAVESLLKRFTAVAELEQVRFPRLPVNNERSEEQISPNTPAFTSGSVCELNYALRLKKKGMRPEFVSALNQIPGILDMRLRFDKGTADTI
ncbi:MAG: DUF4956 domain-containing protein [Saprospiraceae bacterium]